jgi:hypothetical protein
MYSSTIPSFGEISITTIGSNHCAGVMHQSVLQPAFRMAPCVECEEQVTSRFIGRMANVDALIDRRFCEERILAG